jgi:hypothetical protein
MVYRGMINDGVVVLPAGVTLPEGTEVLVALPDQPAEAVIRGTTAELGRRVGISPTNLPPVPVADRAQGADHPRGPAGRLEEPRGYPVADFLSPTEYAWDEDVYAAEEAVRAYLSDCHADH